MGPQILKQAPTTGEPCALLSRCRTSKGKWDGDTVMFPGKGFKLGFADGVISVVAASCKAVWPQSLPKWRP